METCPPQNSNPADPVSVQVIKQVAAHEGIDPVDVSPPLHSVIDTSALDSLFEPANDGHSRTGRVSFDYRGHTVVVEQNDRVEIGISENDPPKNSQDEILS
ncbi:HalOD1 output domain-containing protein [Halostagnicola bangensis]